MSLIQHTHRTGTRYRTLCRRQGPRDQTQQRALARAVATDDAGALMPERQAQIVE
jgi:hypothetical protein